MKYLRYLLLPFSWLYGIGVRFRNWLFDTNLKKSKRFNIPVIGIGNLSAGGTGKTPMAEYILKLLIENGYHPAMLSRGYGRQTKGFLEVRIDSIAKDVGDEPYQVKRKMPQLVVAVCEDRVSGIESICKHHPKINVIILDDSYQHRYVNPGFNILLTDYSKPFYNDQLLPSGMLREPKTGKKRADVIIITKCPNLPDEAQKISIKNLVKPLESQELYFTSIVYESLIREETGSRETSIFPISNLKGYQILLFTGIAKTKPLEQFLKSEGVSFFIMPFSDHHDFTTAEVKKIIQKYDSFPAMNKLILTTEKDWRRIEGNPEIKLFANLPIYYLPISVAWEPNEKLKFDQKIINYVQAHQGNF